MAGSSNSRLFYCATVHNDSGGVRTSTGLTSGPQAIGANEFTNVAFSLGQLIRQASEKAPLFRLPPRHSRGATRRAGSNRQGNGENQQQAQIVFHSAGI